MSSDKKPNPILLKRPDQLLSRPKFFNTCIFKDKVIRINPFYSLICNMVLGLILILVSVNIIFLTSENTHIDIRYDQDCQGKEICEIELEIKEGEDIKGPVFIYFYYQNFFMNHRKIIFGYDMKQITGDNVPRDSVSKLI